MKNDPQNMIFHLLLTARKNWQNYGFFFQKKTKKQKKSENYTNDGMVTESSPCDFRNFFRCSTIEIDP